jgi:SAM-dependent methyltransferase
MTDERLHFDAGACAPDVMTAAEHLARYAVLAPFVKGKRVLDIACGEGYGSWFLREWGAREVVGIDISPDAIENARKYFGRDGVTFRAGDACRAADQLEKGSFDLVVSFETIEHVGEPRMLLEGLRLLCAPGGGIFVSCPNDHIAMSAESSNPYHLEKYTFEQFKELSESVLGKASQWLLGSNVQGYALIPEGDPIISKPWDDWKDIVESRAFPAFHLLPSQANVRPDRSNVLYYMGVWGVQRPVAAVAVTAQSFPAFVEPWKTIDWLKARLSAASVEEDLTRLACSMPDDDGHPLSRRLANDLAETRHRVLVLADIVSGVAAERAGLQALAERVPSLEGEVQRLESVRTRHEAEIADLRALSERVPSLQGEVQRLESVRASHEAEIADLRALSERVPSLAAEVLTLTALVEQAEAESIKRQAVAERVPALESALQLRDDQLSMILNSRSWRLTRVMRAAGRLLRGEFGVLRQSIHGYTRGRGKRP